MLNVTTNDPVRTGREIRERRVRYGMEPGDLAGLAGVSRSTIYKVEKGEAKELTVGKVLKALDDFAEETGADEPPRRNGPEEPHLVEFRVEGVVGVEAIVVKGPVEDVRAFEQSIARILRQVQGGEVDPTGE